LYLSSQSTLYELEHGMTPSRIREVDLASGLIAQSLDGRRVASAVVAPIRRLARNLMRARRARSEQATLPRQA
jgi:hypothetical protein